MAPGTGRAIPRGPECGGGLEELSSARRMVAEAIAASMPKKGCLPGETREEAASPEATTSAYQLLPQEFLLSQPGGYRQYNHLTSEVVAG